MVSISSLLNLLDGIEKGRIAVIGDVILDQFVHGSVERISPESPVPVLSATHERSMLGGAGNTYANLASLGTHVHFMSVCGDDSDADRLNQLLADSGFAMDHITFIRDASRKTAVKTRFMAGHHHLLRSDSETIGDVSDQTAKQLKTAIIEIMSDLDVIILSDYGKGVLRDDVITSIIDAANNHDVKVIVDPKGKDFSKYRGAYAITPNKKELHEATDMPIETDTDITTAANHIIESCRIECVVATRSAQGISVVAQNKTAVHIPTLKLDVYDVSGAGDTVIATIAAGLAAGGSVSESAFLSNVAGGIVVSKVGTAIIRADEIADTLNDPEHTQAMGLIDNKATDNNGAKGERDPHSTIDEALEMVERWRSKGFTVGFTNGCFDIVHKGHVTYLSETKSHCDRLIVGLNHDQSVRILKGESRPVHDEIGRATLLKGLKSVDCVVLFGATETGGDNTAIALLETLKPDVYFKGGDYVVSDIPEAPTVQAYGGDVLVLSEIDGQSTTASLARLKQA